MSIHRLFCNFGNKSDCRRFHGAHAHFSLASCKAASSVWFASIGHIIILLLEEYKEKDRNDKDIYKLLFLSDIEVVNMAMKKRLIHSGFYDLATAYQSVHVNIENDAYVNYISDFVRA